MPPPAPSWIDAEPGYFALRHELARLAVRARRRRGRVLLGAGALTAAAVVFAWQAPRNYVAQISVRVTEVLDADQARSQWTDRQIKSFAHEMGMRNDVLERAYTQYLADIAPAPSVARGVERLREDVEVEAVRTRIMVETDDKRPLPRAAHIVLRFGAKDEDRARAVLRTIAQPIVESSARQRRLEAEQQLERVSLQLEKARAQMASLRDQALAYAGTPLAEATTGRRSPTAVIALDASIKAAHERVALAQQAKDEAQMRARAEAKRAGIDFVLAEENVSRPFPMLVRLLGVALFTLLFALPLVAAVVGAASDTIDSVDDIRRLGIPVLGRLPRFPGVTPPRSMTPPRAPSGGGAGATL